MGTPEPAGPVGPRATAGLGRRDLLAGGLLGKAPPPQGIVLPEGAKPSYAQFGDDLVADSLFKGLGVEWPTYLDIGANDPVVGNNTFLFYLVGCRGVLIEPDVSLSAPLRETRPEDKLLVAGIGTEDRAEADYYVIDQPGLNTFDKEQADRLVREKGYRIERVVKMPLLGINRVIAEHFGGRAPDFVSIDIEGLDLAVMRTLDFTRYRPKVICAETLVTGTFRHNPGMTELLTANGYEVRGMTFPNTFYVDGAILKEPPPRG
jgi:FkbM family methyltransferase